MADHLSDDMWGVRQASVVTSSVHWTPSTDRDATVSFQLVTSTTPPAFVGLEIANGTAWYNAVALRTGKGGAGGVSARTGYLVRHVDMEQAQRAISHCPYDRI